MNGCPPWALDDEMLTIRPQPASIMWGMTTWQQWNVPVRLTSSTRFHASGVIFRNGPKPCRPALLTRIVGRPSRSHTSTTPASRPGRSVTSTSTPMAVPPVAAILVAASSAASPLRSKMATAAPSAASRSLMARPMPEAPPVTMAMRSAVTGSARRRRRSCGACRGATSGRRGSARCSTPRLSQITTSPTDHSWRYTFSGSWPGPAGRRARPGPPRRPCPRRGGGGAEHQRAAARPVLPHQRVLLGRALAPVGDLLGRGVGDGRALRRLDRVDDPHRREALLLVVGEVVVGGVGAGELGLAARLGHRVGAEHGGHDRDVVGAAVDVPVEGAAQVGGRGVLRRVERDPEDLGVVAAAELLDLAQPPAEGHLRLVVDVQVAEHQRAVGLERLEAPGREVVVVEQAVLVDALDQRADGGV